MIGGAGLLLAVAGAVILALTFLGGFVLGNTRLGAGLPLPFPFARTVVADPAGRIYVANTVYQRASAYDADGRFLGARVLPPRKSAAVHVATDTLGQLWAFNGVLRRWSASGELTGEWTPEPAVWARRGLRLAPDGGWIVGVAAGKVPVVKPVAPGEPLFPYRAPGALFVAEGRTYAVVRHGWTWSIERTGGGEMLRIDPPALLTLVAFPVPGAPLGLGLLLVGVLLRHRRFDRAG